MLYMSRELILVEGATDVQSHQPARPPAPRHTHKKNKKNEIMPCSSDIQAHISHQLVLQDGTKLYLRTTVKVSKVI